jgi:hypothetical protein
MSSEDFENLICLVGPAVNKKNKNYQPDGMLGHGTEITCNWEFVCQHDAPI